MRNTDPLSDDEDSRGFLVDAYEQLRSLAHEAHHNALDDIDDCSRAASLELPQLRPRWHDGLDRRLEVSLGAAVDNGSEAHVFLQRDLGYTGAYDTSHY